MYPFLLHSLSMSVFSSVIGPFGGFFASGFKRAFKIKVEFKKENEIKLSQKINFCLFFFAGLWRYDSWPWWNYGSVWLSIFDGYICKCIHFQLYTYRISSKTSATGILYLSIGLKNVEKCTKLYHYINRYMKLFVTDLQFEAWTTTTTLQFASWFTSKSKHFRLNCGREEWKHSMYLNKCLQKWITKPRVVDVLMVDEHLNWHDLSAFTLF